MEILKNDFELQARKIFQYFHSFYEHGSKKSLNHGCDNVGYFE